MEIFLSLGDTPRITIDAIPDSITVGTGGQKGVYMHATVAVSYLQEHVSTMQDLWNRAEQAGTLRLAAVPGTVVVYATVPASPADVALLGKATLGEGYEAWMETLSRVEKITFASTADVSADDLERFKAHLTRDGVAVVMLLKEHAATEHSRGGTALTTIRITDIEDSIPNIVFD